jgi:LysM repeat protein
VVSPENTGRSAKKLKNTLFFKLLLAGVSFAILATPLLASAGTFSFLANLINHTADVTSASTPLFNSQTVPLLAAAINIDPNPPVGGGDITAVDGSALLSQEGPSGTTADTTNQPSASQISVYVVRPGDTLSEIASMFGVNSSTILGANDIPGGVIHPGQTLVILPIIGIQHTVAKGETLASLATNYKSDAASIAQYNGLALSDSLTVGATIIIPNGEAGVSTVSTGTSAAKPSAKSSTPNTAIARVKVLAQAGKPTSKLHGTSQLDEGNYYACPVAGILTQGLHGYDAVDIGAPKGTTIHAAAGGQVIVAKFGGWNGGYGSYVVIAHGNGTQTLYAHMSKVIATEGSVVGQGDTLGLVGQTGEATGPHLHFEVRGAVNPFGSLSLGEGCE